MGKIKITTVSDIYGIKEPSNYFIRDADGNRVYFHCNSRNKAQEEADKIYGKGKYKVRCSVPEPQKKPLTARG